MKYLAMVIVLLGIRCTHSQAESTLSVEIGFGSFIHNSENSQTIMGEGEFANFNPIGVSYGSSDFFGIPVNIAYEFRRNANTEAIEYWAYNDQSPSYGDVILVNHVLDASYQIPISKFFTYGFGPTLVVTNRIVDIKDILFDRLVSYGLGANGFIKLSVLRIPAASPFNTEWIAVNFMLKSRYTHSLFFDKGPRKLDGYHQSFFSTIATVGVELMFK